MIINYGPTALSFKRGGWPGISGPYYNPPGAGNTRPTGYYIKDGHTAIVSLTAGGGTYCLSSQNVEGGESFTLVQNAYSLSLGQKSFTQGAPGGLIAGAGVNASLVVMRYSESERRMIDAKQPSVGVDTAGFAIILGMQTPGHFIVINDTYAAGSTDGGVAWTPGYSFPVTAHISNLFGFVRSDGSQAIFLRNSLNVLAYLRTSTSVTSAGTLTTKTPPPAFTSGNDTIEQMVESKVDKRLFLLTYWEPKVLMSPLDWANGAWTQVNFSDVIPSGYVKQYCMVVTSTGRICVFFMGASPNHNDLLYSYSDDEGATWVKDQYVMTADNNALGTLQAAIPLLNGTVFIKFYNGYVIYAPQ